MVRQSEVCGMTSSLTLTLETGSMHHPRANLSAHSPDGGKRYDHRDDQRHVRGHVHGHHSGQRTHDTAANECMHFLFFSNQLELEQPQTANKSRYLNSTRNYGQLQGRLSRYLKQLNDGRMTLPRPATV